MDKRKELLDFVMSLTDEQAEKIMEQLPYRLASIQKNKNCGNFAKLCDFFAPKVCYAISKQQNN